MKRKFTMLLASLFLMMGTVKADFVQEYTKTGAFWTAAGTEYPEGLNNTTDAGGGKGNASQHIGVNGHSVYKAEVDVIADGGNITVTFAYVSNQGLGTNQHAASFLGVDVLKDGEVVYHDYHLSFVGGSPQSNVYTLTGVEAGNYTLRYFICSKAGDHDITNTGGTITVTGAIQSGLVDLTINYTINGVVKSTTTAELLPGESYAIPAPTYTKIAACKIGETVQTVTNGACTITVPAEAATIIVELANNFPFETSTDFNNATWYVLQIRSNNKKYVVRSTSAPYANTTTTPTTEDALWAFVGNPFDGIQVLNKAAGAGQTLGLDNSNNGVMTENGKTWNITQGNGGFLLRDGNSGNRYIHDYSSTLKIWDNGSAAGDAGSAFVVTSEAEMISLATTALNTLKALMSHYEEASYYTYSDEALAAANATLQGVATPTIILAALQAKATTESVQAALDAAGKGTTGPVAGDYIQLKNRQHNKYLKGFDSDASGVDSKADLATIWEVVDGTDGNVKLKNQQTGKYIGQIRQSETVAMTDEANAAQFSWTNQDKVYAVFKDVTGGDYAYGHVNGGKLVGWEKGSSSTQWVVSNVCPLSITYLYNGAEVSTSSTIVEKGAVYTVTSPVDFTKPGACKKGEEALEAVDGVFSFEVTGTTTLTVELTDDLPFVTTTLNEDGSFPENTTWYVVKQHSSNGYAWAWKYDATNGITAYATTDYTDNHLWCFAGSKDDLKIYNKVAGKGFSLTNTDPASMAAENAAVWKMVKSNNEDSFAGKNPFCLQKGNDNSYLNAQSNVLKYWSSRDQGSTIMVIAQQPLSIKYMYKGAELTDLSVNKLVDAGYTHTVTNPYANKYVNVGCTVNGNRVEAVDGQWTVNVTEPTSVIVTITDNLPFKTSTSFDTANWQYLQINSEGWEYVRNYVANGEENTYANTTNSAELDEGALWAFVGDALGGFKILNKKAGEGFTLSYDGEMANGTAAYMKQEEKTWTIEKGNGGFIIRQGANQCLNDFGDRLKVWADNASPNGAGSAFKTINAGVKNLSDLYNSKIYVLQAERSQLMYDANASAPNKLSSGMANNIAANGSDANQQFMIFSSATEGAYYLYSVGAAKFVDASLNFTDYPEPVLSFEANEGNSVFPWFVKIGGKYVVPSVYGDAGNSLYHTETPSADVGKWYRIEEVDEDMSLAVSVSIAISHAEGLIKNASSLNNSKVYTVSTYDRGGWYAGDQALTHTMTAYAEDPAQQFAFLTVGGKTYLYSVEKQQFVVKSDNFTAYSDVPTQPVVFLEAAGNKFYPIVVAFVDGENQRQIGISHGFTPSVITFNNDLTDDGNKVDIREAGELASLADVVAGMEAYLNAQTLVPALNALITKASNLLTFLPEGDKTSAIANAKTAAEDVLAGSYNADQLNENIEALTAAINDATLVKEIDGFDNAYVYTFVSERGWMGADATNGVISGTGADDNANYQWAVYKSTREHYYLYNIGKAQFMGVETTNNAQMPFSATPQTTGLTFKKSDWANYPIMFSMDNQSVVNNNNGGKMICWTGGWNKLDDGGSNHKVAIVGALTEATLATITAAVELYETQGMAVQALDAAIAAAQAKVNGMGEGLGYYTSTDANAAATLATIVEFKNAITAETTVVAIEAQTAAANALVETFKVKLPEAGKFYRFSYDYADGVKYVQAVASNVSGKANVMVMTADQGAASIFYYDGGADAESVEDDRLLSYSAGQYVNEISNTRGLQDVGNTGGKAKFEAGSKAGKLYIFAGDSFHANKSGDICFIDHCGDGHPDQAEDKHNFTVEEVTELPVTISAVGYTTLYAPVALEIPEGLEAYVASETTDNYVKLQKIEDVIPAETGVVVKANGLTEATTRDFAILAESGTKVESLFEGTYAKTYITPGNAICYVLANGNSGVGLYKASLNKQNNTAFLNNQWKVYLPVATVEGQSAPALAFRFVGNEPEADDDTTGIEDQEIINHKSEMIFDLTGRRIEKIVEKGIYIVNGKKVVIK